MHTSGPSQSQWGDPTHAQIWASTTASSSRVSLVGSTCRHDNDENDTEVGQVTLPPIVKRNEGNPFGFLSLPNVFELTKAFRFSYY